MATDITAAYPGGGERLCARCGRDRAGQPQWIASRRLCHSCYVYLWKRRRLDPPPGRAPQPPAVCRHTRPHRHGTRACYVKDRCRCAACRGANAAYENTRHARRALVDATGAARRLEDLEWLSHSTSWADATARLSLTDKQARNMLLYARRIDILRRYQTTELAGGIPQARPATTR